MIILKQWDLLGQFKVIENLKYVYLLCLCCGVKDCKLVGTECCKEKKPTVLLVLQPEGKQLCLLYEEINNQKNASFALFLLLFLKLFLFP